MPLRMRLMLLVAGCAIASMAHGQGSTARQIGPSQRYGLAAPAAGYVLETEGVDRAKALAADLGTPKSAPLRYALSREIHNAAFSKDQSVGGEWRDLPDGMALWRLPVHAAAALTLDFGFRHLFLPQGAQMFLGNANRQLGPYTDADNTRSGQFWTPLLYGDEALIEVLLPQKMKAFLQIDLGTVHVGYRDIFAPASRAKSFFDPDVGSGSCNVDTICPQGDPWRNEINAEAVAVLNGGFCSGQLLNDARNDHVPYFSTANHCIATQADATSLVVYWKYESPVCRAVGSAASGMPVPTDNAIAQTGGAQLIATYEPADFTLVKLNTTPPAVAKVYWNGWDNTESPFSGAVVMHHPMSDAKRISFAAGTVTLEDDAGSTDLPGLHHWQVDHYSLGTTEEGSSGSGLLDANHHVRGVLSGGAAECSDPSGNDFYGRLSVAWGGGGSPSNRLRDWLDPDASGASSHDGVGACAAPNVSLSTSANPLIPGEQVTISASASGGVPPYTYAFDVDGDGVPDNLDPNAASLVATYPGAFSGNVGVTVTDQTGCTGSASRALVVQAQSVAVAPNGVAVATSSQLCGNADDLIDPGERWQVSIPLQNNGSLATSGGYAVFAQDLSQPGQASITLETPAVALPALAPGASTSVNISYAVAANASCNAPLKLDYLGTADANGFTANPATVVSEFVNPDPQCQPQACTAQVTPITPNPGNFFDPRRPGNGMTEVLTPIAGADPIFFGAWFTGDAARQPTWYVLNAALHANQVNYTLYQTQLNSQNPFAITGNAVGTAQVSLISANEFIYTWTLNGVPGGAIYVPVVADPASSVRSWFNASQSGWGTFDELFPSAGTNGRPFMFNLAYIYDNAGTPRWTVGSNSSYSDGNLLSEMVAQPACPGCVWLDYTIGAKSVGTLSYLFNGSNPSISTQLTLPAAYPGSWVRAALPLIPLVPPQ
ncbi:MAG: hypothetical protein P4L92_08815 [Rudaea sp.]|nr:hypothetical protein [Rudaea sp.]